MLAEYTCDLTAMMLAMDHQMSEHITKGCLIDLTLAIAIAYAATKALVNLIGKEMLVQRMVS